MATRYSVAEARNQFTRILRSVEQGEAVELTRRGKPVAVLVSAKDFARLQDGRITFWEAYTEFMKRPEHRKGLLRPDEFRDLRDRSPGRKVTL
jgi:prevent-host-death family protein